MLWGRYASQASEARYPQLWQGRVFGACPSVQGPAGLNLYDTTGRGRHGTLTNMDAPTDWVRSQGLYALDFDGTDDTVAHSSVSMTGACSVSLWFYKRSNGLYNARILWGNVSDNDTYVGNVTTTTINTQSDSVGTQKNYTFSISNNQWYHFAMIRDANNSVRLFVNGIESTSGAQTVTGTYTLNRIGQYANNAGGNTGFMWDGLLDDIAIYNLALTPGKIRLLATRRGIAYEARRDVLGGTTANRLRRILCGGNC